jgi:hypothetical protein
MDLDEMRYFGGVGMHQHALLLASGQTNISGPHEHIWLVTEKVDTEMGELYEGMILFSEHDGAHSHALSGARTAEGGDHVHAVRVRGFNVASGPATAHGHELSIQDTGRDGAHSHALTIGGMTMQSLMPADFHAAMLKKMTVGEVEPPAITRSGGGYAVELGGKTLSKHETREGAEKAAQIHNLLEKCGWHTDLSLSERLAKSTGLMVEKSTPKVFLGGGLLGKMDQLLKDCDRPGSHF